MNNSTESTYAYDRQRERLQGMLLMANADSIRETQNASAIDSQFQLVENVWNNFYLVTSLRNNSVLPQTNGLEYQITSYLCPTLRTQAWYLSDFYSTKMINSSQFMETLKVKTTSLKEPMRG